MKELLCEHLKILKLIKISDEMRRKKRGRENDDNDEV